MKVVRVNKPGNLEICEVEIPEILKANEVLLKVKAAGICGSDMHIFQGTSPVATYPRIIGHEFAGEIVQVGSQVKDCGKGDHVVINPVISCGTCYPCSIGRNNVCTDLKVRGVHTDGGYAEYVAVAQESIYPISKKLDWEEAALIEPFTIAAQTTARGRVAKEDFVLVIGAGPIGLAILQVVKKIGAYCLIADLMIERLRLAAKLGADIVINPAEEDIAEVIFRKTKGLGATVVIEAVGIPQLLEQAVKIAAPAGRIVVLGFNEKPSQINQLDITKKELDICGSRLHTNKFPQVIEWFNNNELDPKALISHTLPFFRIQEAFNLIENYSRQTCKVILTF